MTRKIITIDAGKCNGCGVCVDACHEGAIGMRDGKAVLLRDDYCDGLGSCLPACPAGAITFEEREAVAYNEEAVQKAKEERKPQGAYSPGCPGSAARAIVAEGGSDAAGGSAKAFSSLRQWPVQIRLVPVKAAYFDNADLLVSADCAAYAYGTFHQDFMKNSITIIGCPKLDDTEYSEKLTTIIRENAVRSVTAVRMEVPCCGGIENAAVTAVKRSGKTIPLRTVTISIEGNILPCP